MDREHGIGLPVQDTGPSRQGLIAAKTQHGVEPQQTSRVPFKPSQRGVLAHFKALHDAAIRPFTAPENVADFAGKLLALEEADERLLDEVSFNAPELSGSTREITAADVDQRLGELARNEDLSRFIL